MDTSLKFGTYSKRDFVTMLGSLHQDETTLDLFKLFAAYVKLVNLGVTNPRDHIFELLRLAENDHNFKPN